MSQQFDSNPFSQGGQPESAGNSPPVGAVRREQVPQSIRSTTIKQLSEATQVPDGFRIDNVTIGQITVVAHLVAIRRQTTNTVYDLEDGGGLIEARCWIDVSGEEGNDIWGEIVEGKYVRVTGSLKIFDRKRYINATHIRLIEDFNELSFHIFEVMVVTLKYDQGPPSDPGQGHQRGSMINGQPQLSNYSAQQSAVAPDAFSRMPPLQRAIMDFIASQSEVEGIHVGAIAKVVGGDPDAISAAIDGLMDDGQIFSTIDDLHFEMA